MLLGIPAGQKGRQHPLAGDEGIDGRSLAHGRTIAEEERRRARPLRPPDGRGSRPRRFAGPRHLPPAGAMHDSGHDVLEPRSNPQSGRRRPTRTGPSAGPAEVSHLGSVSEVRPEARTRLPELLRSVEQRRVHHDHAAWGPHCPTCGDRFRHSTGHRHDHRSHEACPRRAARRVSREISVGTRRGTPTLIQCLRYQSGGSEPITSTSSATTATEPSSSVFSSIGANSGLTGSSTILTCRQPPSSADFSLR